MNENNSGGLPIALVAAVGCIGVGAGIALRSDSSIAKAAGCVILIGGMVVLAGVLIARRRKR